MPENFWWLPRSKSVREWMLDLLEAEREVVLDVRGGIGIVGQLLVVVETVVVVAEAQGAVPGHAGLLPTVPPLHLGARAHEELHLHLLELAHAEDELAGYDFVTESLTNLGDTERNLHTTGLLYIQVIYEDTLCRFRTKVYLHGTIGSGTHLC